MDIDVAFLGLGNMGLPMASNLVRAGVSVSGHDLVTANVEKFLRAGGKTEPNSRNAIAAAKTVITMLPASCHVEDAYLGDDGILAHVQSGALLIDCSTIAPDSARKVAAEATARGCTMIDAPVSGGTAGAAAATLTFMVGGTETGLAAARPYLEKMGKAVFHAGGYGAGQTVKMCNNMLLAIQMIGTCEAIRLGIANGIEPKLLSEILSKSSGRNWTLEVYNPCPGVMPNVPASRDYRGGFGVDLMRKDLGLAVENALATNSSVPMGALARSLYDLHSHSGAGMLDFSSIFRLFDRAS